MISDKWTLKNLPPKGDPDVGEFANLLFEAARLERERLNVTDRFLVNFALYKGKSVSQQQSGRKGYVNQSRGVTTINLYFSNVERTVQNITSRNPTGEVVDMDGFKDDAQNILSMELKKWWKDTDQQQLTKLSAKTMEIYGIIPEKPSWDKNSKSPAIDSMDPFAFFPCPGNWEGDEINTKCPYIGYAYLEFVSEIEGTVWPDHPDGVKDIQPSEAYDLMGGIREKYSRIPQTNIPSIGNYADPMTVRTNSDSEKIQEKKLDRCLVIELWCRDNSTKTVKTEEPLFDDQGNPVLDENQVPQVKVTSTVTPVYRDGIRKITFTKSKAKDNKSGWEVLDDCENPNINPELDTEKAINTYPWGRLPCYYVCSYKDGVSIWGFSAAEMVSDLLVKINLIITKLIAYTINVMAPPLIVQQHCGITREMIESSIQKAGRLILMPSTPNARIEFLQVPNLPETFFKVFDLLIRMFDRTYQIENADRGVQPTGVIAASAIVALQEKNMVLMQAKTNAVDTLVENRSRWAIGLWQNHGTAEDRVDIAGESKSFIGTNYAGRKFDYVVESGSMTPRTSLQLQEDAKWLYKEKAISQKGLLEALHWPGWKEEIARTADNQLDQALQVLIDAGLPQQSAVQIKQVLENLKIQMDDSKGSGDSKTSVDINPNV
jgi:hypothetical protein